MGGKSVPEGVRPRIWLDAASQSSDLEENRCDRRRSMWRSLISRFRACPARGPLRWAGHARGREIRLRRFWSKSELREAKSGQIFGPLSRPSCSTFQKESAKLIPRKQPRSDLGHIFRATLLDPCKLPESCYPQTHPI